MIHSIIVVGASGYVGGRLVPRLLGDGHRVRCIAPKGAGLEGRSWADRAEIVSVNNWDAMVLEGEMRDTDVAYFLLEPTDPSEDPDGEEHRKAAHAFGKAAEISGLQRIIYLGSLPPLGGAPSRYVRLRIEAGVILRKYRVPVTELRAGAIIGSGSLAFELIRYVTERVPVLIAPNWVSTRLQPIAIRNVLQYLVQALDVPDSRGKIIPIGGEEVLSYRDMFRMYAEIRGLRRIIITLPMPSIRLSSIWLSLVTPITGGTARRFIEGLTGDLVVMDDLARRLFDVRLLGYSDTVRLALRRFAEDQVDTMWTDVLRQSSPVDLHEQLSAGEGVIAARIQSRSIAGTDRLWEAVCSVGGDSGWPYANALWKIRGMIDFLIGGVGNRTVRRSLGSLRVGDTIDFWRVEVVDRPTHLRLRAEMKVPGKAWLEYRIREVEDGGAEIVQTAIFEPKGLMGVLYWYLFYIPHRFIFPGMVRELVARAERPWRPSNGRKAPLTSM